MFSAMIIKITFVILLLASIYTQSLVFNKLRSTSHLIKSNSSYLQKLPSYFSGIVTSSFKAG